MPPATALGVRGAEAAEVDGELAGLAAARDAGNLAAGSHEKLARPLLRRAAGLSPFTDAVGPPDRRCDRKQSRHPARHRRLPL